MSSTAPAAQPVDPAGTRVIVLVGIAHSVSHFFPPDPASPLFPWLKEAFDLSYSELGLLMTVFFVISGIGQSLVVFWSIASDRCR